jgi:hypothetical protein
MRGGGNDRVTKSNLILGAPDGDGARHGDDLGHCAMGGGENDRVTKFNLPIATSDVDVLVEGVDD